ncbi:hypothetical protein BWR17_09690 [Phaeobacter inhibens]|nr:hypothetical protein BWR17_09690 [Phaeobacter inhibens]
MTAFGVVKARTLSIWAMAMISSSLTIKVVPRKVILYMVKMATMRFPAGQPVTSCLVVTVLTLLTVALGQTS